MNADRVRDTQSFDSVEGSSRQSENANGAPKGNSESVELSSELADLFRRGTDMTKEIARRVETCKAAYLGQSKKRPRFLLSATFDSKTGPSLPYFTETIHTLRPVIRDRRPRYGEQLDVFERASGETLELLRVFFGLLSDFLNPAQAEQLRIALYTFRTANGRFFRHLRNGGDLAESVFSSIVSEGIALSTASMYLDILAGALRTRERQLGYLTDQLPDAQAPDRSKRISRKVNIPLRVKGRQRRSPMALPRCPQRSSLLPFERNCALISMLSIRSTRTSGRASRRSGVRLVPN